MPDTPTKQTIEKCALMGWEYQGEGLFLKWELIAWFENGSFKKEGL